MVITLPTAVETAIQQLNTAGYEAYAVGGCVRDSLLGKTPTDWDITTSATPTEMQGVFASYRTVETGLKHGTLTVLIDDMPLEITTYRVEGAYSDGRHPDSVSFTRCLSEDLCRRDFTINAMAYHPVAGVVDLYGGREDLTNGLISCVGESEKRFSEDALRILRALRFASVLGFRITKDTECAIRALYPTLSCVSIERIATELGKLLCGTSAQRIVSDCFEVVLYLIPELQGAKDFYLLSIVPPVSVARWAALFYCCDLSSEAVGAVLRRLRLDNHTIRDVKTLIDCRYMPHDSDGDLLRLLNRLNDGELLRDYLALVEMDGDTCLHIERLIAENRCYKTAMLAVSGDDVIACGFHGPEIGSVLAVLLNAVMDGNCQNEKQELIAYMKTIKKPVQ